MRPPNSFSVDIFKRYINRHFNAVYNLKSTNVSMLSQQHGGSSGNAGQDNDDV